MNEVYLQKMNKKETNERLVSLRTYALQHNVPIITFEGIQFLHQIVQLKGVKRILEIGTAIGYSSLHLAMHHDVEIVTIEKSEEMYQEAVKNIQETGYESQISVIHSDALEVDESTLGMFDLVFIDAAKAQSIKFFEKFEICLNKSGVIVTDNLLFHGLVYSEIKDRNLKQLVRKINTFNEYVVAREEYDTFIYNVGDGMSVSIRKV